MAGLHNFDPDGEYDKYPLIPDGDYTAAIVSSEEKQNSKGTGSFLELVFEILEGTHKGRRLWENLNLDNPSEMCVRIAKKQLQAICKALGSIHPTDSVELENIPMIIRLGSEKREDIGEQRNVIKRFLSTNYLEDKGSKGSPSPQPGQTITVDSKGHQPAPWKR